MGLFRELPDRSNSDSCLVLQTCPTPSSGYLVLGFLSPTAVRLLLFKETAELGRREWE